MRELTSKEKMHGPCPCCGTEWTTHEYIPPCPPIAPIREAAKEFGYAIGVHGSLKRDYDLIAVPWTKDAIGNGDLIGALCERVTKLTGKTLKLLPGTVERKPNGRYACTLQFDAWLKHIDLSIAPTAPEEPPGVTKANRAFQRMCLTCGTPLPEHWSFSYCPEHWQLREPQPTAQPTHEPRAICKTCVQEFAIGEKHNCPGLQFTFSGWGGKLTEGERAVVENREPKRCELDHPHHYACTHCGIGPPIAGQPGLETSVKQPSQRDKLCAECKGSGKLYGLDDANYYVIKGPCEPCGGTGLNPT
jgi:hypothetical protein